MTRSTALAAVGLALFLVFATTAAASTPTISYTIDGVAGTNGWYRGSAHGDNVILHWSVSNALTSSNCEPAVTIPGPTTGTTRTCSAQNSDGTATAVVHIKIDATPPTGVTFHLSRPPDFDGWYNHPVAIRWSGSDATSGIAYCTSGTYRGPDGAAATANGGCYDRAGNSAGRQVRIEYDATPPALRRVREQSTATADVLSWSSSSATDHIVVRRRVRGRKAHPIVFNGSASGFTDARIRPGAEYVYSVQAIDQAGNRSKIVPVDGPAKILILQKKTRFAPHAAPKPILRWRRIAGAAYYNVQLFRGTKRIFSAWPRMTQIGLPAAWRWSGRRRYLIAGRYHWYVWAGFGPRALARYRIVGSARFVLPHA